LKLHAKAILEAHTLIDYHERGSCFKATPIETPAIAAAVQTRRSLMDDLKRMRYRCRTIQEMIARWKVAAERLKQRNCWRNHPQDR
jgi:hypothetical protein